MKAILKKTGRITWEISKLVVAEGIISIASQKLREVSKANYISVKEDSRQVKNMTVNMINGTSPDDWDLI